MPVFLVFYELRKFCRFSNSEKYSPGDGMSVHLEVAPHDAVSNYEVPHGSQ